MTWTRVHSVLAGLTAVIAACQQQPPQSNTAQVQAPAGSLSRQDERLLAAASIALPPAGVTAADLPDPNSQGAKLVAGFCEQCHALPHPAMHSAVDWPGVTRRMWLRMEGLVPPTSDVKSPSLSERFVMLDYLNANALKVSGANLPAGTGKESFQLVCSRCHSLPDPRAHSAADWPAVFARMEQNMTRMKVPPLTGTQTTDILVYLRQASTRR
jgi:cytochrome c5